MGKSLSSYFLMPSSPSKLREVQGSCFREKNWLTKWPKGDNGIHNHCKTTILVPTVILDWCLICHLILKATLCDGFHDFRYPDEEIEVCSKGLQLVPCHTGRKWWCKTYPRSRDSRAHYWGAARDSGREGGAYSSVPQSPCVAGSL